METETAGIRMIRHIKCTVLMTVADVFTQDEIKFHIEQRLGREDSTTFTARNILVVEVSEQKTIEMGELK